ncbi:LL-diaminopimelate aminotransferase [Oceanobacillus picturae]|uniref:LL-diaminopimelate aminotransferase n=1 Tax=Oceanobacillus picturae TaxID=171693 RepID=W9AIM4_9BACI|nr:pyridoxal phosphate-dependent aminotransferase [Oceanobacillus picturae]RIU90026.1 pyridoxal phosphate-dependent aminotransferase [Oceanobacillus picturae]CDO02521.1 LL-diaminopimelate aminotransferase [Oceanobacillus picturae]
MQSFPVSDTLKRLPEQFFAKLVKKVQALSSEGHDVINLGQGNPDLPTPNHIVEELKTAADNPVYHKYSPFTGHNFLKEAVATFYKREYDVDIDPESEVAILFGAKTGLVEISQCLLNAGDTALLPDPGYPDYMSGIAMANANPVFMPLLEKNNFLPNYQQLNQAELEAAKLLFLNYPNNPTAGVANKEFFDETIEVAKQNEICVVHDFAYGAIGFDGKKPQSFMQSAGAKDIGVEMYTLSKTYNMAGWRVGFAVGNTSVIKSLNLIQDHLYVSLFGAVQQAAEKALLGDQTAVDELVATYESRRNVFVEKLQEIGWNVQAPRGTFFAWLPVPEGYTSEEFADLLLEKAHVVVAPGNGFGEAGEGFVRAGLLANEDRLAEAAARIGKLGIFKTSY